MITDRPCPPNRLRQLRAFCQAAQTGSISRAAERLNVSQPAVSQLIRGLELELEVSLFDRHGPRIELTGAGRAMLETALPLIEAMDNLPAAFRERLGQELAGSLDIAAGESTILYLLPEYVRHYADLYPEVRLHLHNVTGRDGLQLLRDGEVDLAVGSMISLPAEIDYRPVLSYEPMLITALDHPLAGRQQVSLEQVSRCGLILPPRHLSTWHMVDLMFRKHGLEYRVVLEAGGWEVIKRFVELGLGVSIVTSICLCERDRLARIPLSAYFPRRSYGIVTRKGKALSPQARRFVELIDPAWASTPLEDQDLSGREGGRRSVDFTGHDQALP